MVFCVGLTGSIASGKTTVSSMFSTLGIQTISADLISRQLSLKNGLAYNDIVTHFGQNIIQADGELNRRQLRDLIFSNPNERVWLEDLLHPLIRQELKAQALLTTTPYCLLEIPLLIDKSDYPYLDRILLVTSPELVQIKRVMDRDHSSEEQAKAILSAQPDNTARLNNADDVLVNDEDIQQLVINVELLHQKYLGQAKK